jgi:hypothetical protein
MHEKNKSTQEFLSALETIENTLLLMSFQKYSFHEKGYACYAEYKSNTCIVEFLYGPPEWDIEMIIYTSKDKFEFKDLLQIPKITEWVTNNIYVQKKGNLKAEVLWFLKLLKFSLPIIE